MKFRVKDMDIATGGTLVAILNKKDARHLDLRSGDRILIKNGGKEVTCILDISESKKAVPEGRIGLFEEVLTRLAVRNGSIVHIKLTGKPESVTHIRDKLYGKHLSYQELFHIMDDITHDRLTDIEKTYFVAAGFAKGFTYEEVVDMTRAMVHTGKKLKFSGTVVDKHCLPEDIPTIIRNSNKVKVEPIGEIINGIFERTSPESIQTDGVADFITDDLNGLQVMTFDNGGMIKFVPVTAVYRLPSSEYLYELQLIGNRTIKATEDHTLFVLSQGKIISKPIQDLTEQDYVLVPTGFDSRPFTRIKINTSYALRNYKPFPSEMGITKDFMRLLGYYVAEGFTNYQGVFLNFGAHEEQLINDAANCFSSVFGIVPTVNKPHATATRICVYNKTLAKIFNDSIAAGSQALEKRIPSFIFDVEEPMKREFLRALFNGDGHIRRGYEAIYVTSSQKLSADLQYLLSGLGLTCSVSNRPASQRTFPTPDGRRYISPTAPCYFIYTQARELFGGRSRSNVSFVNLLPISELGPVDLSTVGWEMRRVFKRQSYLTKQSLANLLKHIQSEDVKNIITGKLGVLKVKKIQKVKSTSRFVYDFQVGGYNRFVAGSAPICIHNSIGGIPGNRTTMLIVPILAAAGFTMPKTSSRAITSPAGTADTMECLANVELTEQQIKNVVRKTGACMVHGGSMSLAPADDKIIEVEHPLSIDAEGQLLASVMAKKYSVSAKHVLIDVPMGKRTKANSWKKASHLKQMFELIGKKLGMNIKVIITDGSQPIGYGVGPLLEARDILAILKNVPQAPADLKKKGLSMAGLLLEMTGKFKDGQQKAKEILESGQAWKKMQQIIAVQGKKKMPSLGKFYHPVCSGKIGRVREIDNEVVAKIARMAGAPDDKGAGILIAKKVHEPVQRGDLLYTVYAESRFKLELAIEFLHKGNGYVVG